MKFQSAKSQRNAFPSRLGPIDGTFAAQSELPLPECGLLRCKIRSEPVFHASDDENGPQKVRSKTKREAGVNPRTAMLPYDTSCPALRSEDSAARLNGGRNETYRAEDSRRDRSARRGNTIACSAGDVLGLAVRWRASPRQPQWRRAESVGGTTRTWVPSVTSIFNAKHNA